MKTFKIIFILTIFMGLFSCSKNRREEPRPSYPTFEQGTYYRNEAQNIFRVDKLDGNNLNLLFVEENEEQHFCVAYRRPDGLYDLEFYAIVRYCNDVENIREIREGVNLQGTKIEFNNPCDGDPNGLQPELPIL